MSQKIKILSSLKLKKEEIDMIVKRNIYMAQVNYQYGNNVFIPYSVGTIIAYCKTILQISNNFYFRNPLFLREDPEEVVKKMDNPFIVGLSCYLWNWEYNTLLAKVIKKNYPNTIIVFGGNQTPNTSDGFFLEHPYVDILVHGEGEFSFSEILLESLSSKPDYTKIKGLSIKMPDGLTFKTEIRARAEDLSLLPSPYLSGVFDFMLDGKFVLNASQETNRGCPYTCKFCDWGGSGFKKLVPIEESRIISEFEWFGRNRIEYLFNCDSNYGILSRDRYLTEKMVEIRSKHDNYPKKFRMCTAKNSNEKVFAITKILNDADMNKGATLSFQSMDDRTLEIVNRKNIKIDKFSKLMADYKKANIATYTELIMGMPGETYDSSKKGIDVLLEGQDDNVNLYVYTCTMLPNSGLSDPEYVKRHRIRSVRSPILLAHSTPSHDSITEYQDIVIGTASMPKSDWKRTYLFYWAVQCFHCLGLLQSIAIFFKNDLDIKYSDFYENLIEYFSEKEKTNIGDQVAVVKRAVNKIMTGGRMDIVLPEFGEICWPLEEASFLRLIKDKEKLYEEIYPFLVSLIEKFQLDIGASFLNDLISYQSSIVIGPFDKNKELNIEYDLHNLFTDLQKEKVSLKKQLQKIIIEPKTFFNGKLEDYAREIVWYGRKGGRFYHSNIRIEFI